MIVKSPRHRPQRKFSNTKRIILECSFIECVHCGAELALRRPRHMRKTVQTMDGAVFVAGKSKECTNSSCTHFGKHYYATGVLKYSLPYTIAEYKTQRRRLAVSEAPRQQKHRLHQTSCISREKGKGEGEKVLYCALPPSPLTFSPLLQKALLQEVYHNPVTTIQALVDQHTELLTVLESQALEYQLDS